MQTSVFSVECETYLLLLGARYCLLKPTCKLIQYYLIKPCFAYIAIYISDYESHPILYESKDGDDANRVNGTIARTKRLSAPMFLASLVGWLLISTAYTKLERVCYNT